MVFILLVRLHFFPLLQFHTQWVADVIHPIATVTNNEIPPIREVVHFGAKRSCLCWSRWIIRRTGGSCTEISTLLSIVWSAVTSKCHTKATSPGVWTSSVYLRRSRSLNCEERRTAYTFSRLLRFLILGRVNPPGWRGKWRSKKKKNFRT